MKLDSLNLVELNVSEIENINAGESGWYWVSYYASKLAHYKLNENGYSAAMKAMQDGSFIM